MNNRTKLRRSLTVLSLTILLLAAVTLAWFVNWATPFVDYLNFSSASLNVNVTITDENGDTLPSEDGNAKLVAQNLKPGDLLVYEVKIENKGADCKAFLGLTEIVNYVLESSGTFKEYDLSTDGPKARFSDVLRVSVWQRPEGATDFVEVPGAYRFIGEPEDFFFSQGFAIADSETLELQYRVQFVGVSDEEPLPGGTVPGNSYTEKKLEAKFAVSATLAK